MTELETVMKESTDEQLIDQFEFTHNLLTDNIMGESPDALIIILNAIRKELENRDYEMTFIAKEAK